MTSARSLAWSTIHDNVIAPVDKTLDRASSAVKGAWKRVFG
jgi:hypothetical protein